jgi:AcrR family transcriptional regulator
MAKRATTDEILATAKCLFQEKGYKGASMGLIAEEAGISIGTLYSRFHSKELLFQMIECPELKKYNPEEEIRKQNILNEALIIFSDKGYSETTMDEIAASCSCSKTVLYQHFSSKEELFAAIFLRIDLFEGKEFTFNVHERTLGGFLKTVGDNFLELFEDDNRLNLMRIVISENHSFPQIGEIMYINTVDRVANEVANQLASYADLNTLIECDFKLAARSYLGLLYSFVLSDKLLYPSAKQFTKEEIMDFAVKVFENGLKV